MIFEEERLHIIFFTFRDAMLVPIINCATSIFAGFVIFAILGFMAHSADTTVEKVVSQGIKVSSFYMTQTQDIIFKQYTSILD